MTIYGYARVSTIGQTLEVQNAQLTLAGCSQIVCEKASGANTKRVQLEALLELILPGDVVVVTRLDRFARSARDLLNLVFAVSDKGAIFKSIAESWDTSTPVGKLMLTVLAGVAEYEREIIWVRTMEGRSLAKTKGVRFGRPPKLNSQERLCAITRREAGEAYHLIAASYSVSVSTIARLHG